MNHNANPAGPVVGGTAEARGRASTPDEPRDLHPVDGPMRPRPLMLEAEWQAIVVKIAMHCRWLVYHTHDSRRSHGGFPDLILVRDGRLIAAELKRDLPAGHPRKVGRRELPTDDQLVWLHALQMVPGVEAAVWRPIDQPRVVACLGRRNVPAYSLDDDGAYPYGL